MNRATRCLAVSCLIVISLMFAGCGGGDGGNGAALMSIGVTPVNPTMAAGTTLQFTATGTFSDSTTKDLTALVTWSSSDGTKATISSSSGTNGIVTARAAGPTTITATMGGVPGATSLTVTAATLQSIDVTPANPGIAAGTAQQFSATGTFSDNSTQDLSTLVTWSSSDPSRASISNSAGTNGMATSLAAGTTTITAALGLISGSTGLTVTAATLQAIAVTPANPSIATGTTEQFTATGTYTDGTTQDLTPAVTWSSSDPSRAAISNSAGTSGQAGALAAGTTTITAAAGLVSGQTTLTVTSAALVAIVVTPVNPGISVNPAGTNLQFTATGTYSDSSTQNLTSQVAWSSSDTSRAVISNAAGSKGKATTVASGTTIITAALGVVTGTTNLTITSATLQTIAVTPANPPVFVGAALQFTATGSYSDGSTQDLTDLVTWNSSNTPVAVISNSAGSRGLATAVTVGLTTIRATSGFTQGSTELEVDVP